MEKVVKDIKSIRVAAGRLGGLAPHKKRGGGFHRMSAAKRLEVSRLGVQARKRKSEGSQSTTEVVSAG